MSHLALLVLVLGLVPVLVFLMSLLFVAGGEVADHVGLPIVGASMFEGVLVGVLAPTLTIMVNEVYVHRWHVPDAPDSSWLLVFVFVDGLLAYAIARRVLRKLARRFGRTFFDW